MKKLLSILVVMVMLFSLTACSKEKSSTENSEKKDEIILTVLTGAHPYFQAMITHWEGIAEREGFKLTVLDPEFDTTKLQKITEEIIVKNPKGVVFGPIDTDASKKMIEKIVEAGIPVVTHSIKTDAKVSAVVGDNFEAGYAAGKAAAKYFNDNIGGTPAAGIVGQLGVAPVQEREEGFKKGFKEAFPDAPEPLYVNGEGVRDKATGAANDMLVANPNVNILFGINDDSALGIVNALKDLDRNDPSKVVVAGIDGSEPAFKEVKNPNSAYKIEIGNPPKEMAELSWGLLDKVMNGEEEVKTEYVPMTEIEESAIEEYLTTQYPK